MNPYIPEDLKNLNIDFSKIVSLVGEANAQLAEYNGLLQGMINPAVLLSPLTSQEAVLSSKIEGTQATVEEVLGHEAGEVYDENKERDIKEIMNYRKALILAEGHVGDYGINLNLILQLHAILMDSARGQNKSPGEFRTDQNWIGSYGCTIEEATFVPPSPMQLMNYLQEWENYVKGSDFDVLAQSAIVHAQFELLHPFKDGNGRIGRLLIPLFLFDKKRLIRPMFYLSNYLEKNREEYYARLKALSVKEDWTGWVMFYLKAVVEEARVNINKTKAIMRLYEQTKEKIIQITHSQHSGVLLDSLFHRPIFRVNELSNRIAMPTTTARGLLRQLENEGLIITIKKGSGRRPSTLAFPELINIAEGREVYSTKRNFKN